MLEEDAELWVCMRVNGGLEHGKENVLQHLAEVGHKIPASEDITEMEQNKVNLSRPLRLFSKLMYVTMMEYSVYYVPQVNEKL